MSQHALPQPNTPVRELIPWGRVILTGGIACGKSVVEAVLRDYGVPVLDTDAVVHALYQEDAQLIGSIATLLGSHCVAANGTLDRVALAEAVTGAPDKLAALEALVHPLVHGAIRAFWQQHADSPVCVVSIPIYFEKGQVLKGDSVWVVASDPAIQRERLMTYRGLSAQAAEARLALQWPIAQKIPLADVVIENNETLEAVRQQVAALVFPASPVAPL